uniref:Col_cuticle_N domain-containing protein n=1 Tax=Rhabditophanes sp. KR3021 TaxID=114890 RepID=A0AC35TIF3_9BILA
MFNDIVADRKEWFYKVILIVSLALTVVSWTSILLTFPLITSNLFYYNKSFDNDFNYCEETVSEALIVAKEFSDSGNWTRKRRAYINEYPESNCVCDVTGSPGLPGIRGRDGVRGRDAPNGSPGFHAKLPCKYYIDEKKLCQEPCPVGDQGLIGREGPKGKKGRKGISGKNGKPGLVGAPGQNGLEGGVGIVGAPGDIGDQGVDAMDTPFIPGPNGDIGPQGVMGKIGYPGPPGNPGPRGFAGSKGQPGIAGKDGEVGTVGERGSIGETGSPGNKGICPTYCATDGGTFFVDPPEWFFNKDK